MRHVSGKNHEFQRYPFVQFLALCLLAHQANVQFLHFPSNIGPREIILLFKQVFQHTE